MIKGRNNHEARSFYAPWYNRHHVKIPSQRAKNDLKRASFRDRGIHQFSVPGRTGKIQCHLESLRKISDALQVDPSAFFNEGDDAQDDLSERLEQFHYKDLSNGMKDAGYSPILVTLNPGENEGNPFAHSGYEFLFVVEGVLTVEADGEQFELKEQESTMFDARKIHYWFNKTHEAVRFLLVSSKTN